MAVEARRFSFQPQERDSVNSEAFWPPYDSNQIRLPCLPSVVANSVVQQPLPGIPIGNQALFRDSVSAARKRNRDFSLQEFYGGPPQKTGFCFAGVDVSPQIQQSQLEMDAVIGQHMKKFRSGFDERQKVHAALMASAMGECVMKTLKEKEEQFQRMMKLNLFLQERAKSLYADNQLLRELAQTNEAAANSLRSNLEQILLHSGADYPAPPAVDNDDDAESVCSTSHPPAANDVRLCRSCGKNDSTVLLLPCRHLCLCTSSGGGSLQLRSCPVCNSAMNATLHVNTSP